MRRKMVVMALVIAIVISGIIGSMIGSGDTSDLHDPSDIPYRGNDYKDQLRQTSVI